VGACTQGKVKKGKAPVSESAGRGGPSRKTAATEPSGASTSGNNGKAAQQCEHALTTTLSDALPTAMAASVNVVTAVGHGGSSKANVRQRKERQQQRKAAEAAKAEALQHMSTLTMNEPVCARQLRDRRARSPMNCFSHAASRPTLMVHRHGWGWGGADGQQQCERGWQLVAGSPVARIVGGGEQAVCGTVYQVAPKDRAILPHTRWR
jgi:hypothetical protein